jgi:hypothetical protein
MTLSFVSVYADKTLLLVILASLYTDTLNYEALPIPQKAWFDSKEAC